MSEAIAAIIVWQGGRLEALDPSPLLLDATGPRGGPATSGAED